MVTANSRVPRYVAGDLNAEVAGARTGAAALRRVVERQGTRRSTPPSSEMYDHGEAACAASSTEVPDGTYVGRGEMDDDGSSRAGSRSRSCSRSTGTTRGRLHAHPGRTEGPVNSPLPSTVSATRVIMTMLAGGGEATNEGHFRPIQVDTRPGSMFHALSPSPCFLYGWPTIQAIEVI